MSAPAPDAPSGPPALALVAHDGRKSAMAAFAEARRADLARFRLLATGTTGGLVAERTGLPVERLLSGPMGGDQQIGARVAEGRIAALIFLVDPLSPHPHDVDVKALTRIALVHDLPLALDLATAAMVLDAMVGRLGAPPAGEGRTADAPAAAPEPFVLDPRLAGDSHKVAELRLSRVLLMDDSRFPWAMLVPRRAGLVEIADLSPGPRAQLRAEIDAVAEAVRSLGPCDKLNIAALGNMVPQLHVHVIARRQGDAAWPGPTFGSGPRAPRSAIERVALIARLRAALAPHIAETPPDSPLGAARP